MDKALNIKIIDYIKLEMPSRTLKTWQESDCHLTLYFLGYGVLALVTCSEHRGQRGFAVVSHTGQFGQEGIFRHAPLRVAG